MHIKYKISNDIYNSIYIDQAIVAFQEVGNISYNENELTIEGTDQGETDELFNEFINYVTYLINE